MAFLGISGHDISESGTGIGHLALIDESDDETAQLALAAMLNNLSTNTLGFNELSSVNTRNNTSGATSTFKEVIRYLTSPAYPHGVMHGESKYATTDLCTRAVEVLIRNGTPKYSHTDASILYGHHSDNKDGTHTITYSVMENDTIVEYHTVVPTTDDFAQTNQFLPILPTVLNGHRFTEHDAMYKQYTEYAKMYGIDYAELLANSTITEAHITVDNQHLKPGVQALADDPSEVEYMFHYLARYYPSKYFKVSFGEMNHYISESLGKNGGTAVIHPGGNVRGECQFTSEGITFFNSPYAIARQVVTGNVAPVGEYVQHVTNYKPNNKYGVSIDLVRLRKQVSPTKYIEYATTNFDVAIFTKHAIAHHATHHDYYLSYSTRDGYHGYYISNHDASVAAPICIGIFKHLPAIKQQFLMDRSMFIQTAVTKSVHVNWMQSKFVSNLTFIVGVGLTLLQIHGLGEALTATALLTTVVTTFGYDLVVATVVHYATKFLGIEALTLIAAIAMAAIYGYTDKLSAFINTYLKSLGDITTDLVVNSQALIVSGFDAVYKAVVNEYTLAIKDIQQQMAIEQASEEEKYQAVQDAQDLLHDNSEFGISYLDLPAYSQRLTAYIGETPDAFISRMLDPASITTSAVDNIGYYADNAMGSHLLHTHLTLI